MRIRISEDGLIETLVPSIVIWGLHNERVHITVAGIGFRFNTHNTMVGSWHDLLPLADTKHPYQYLGKGVPATDNDAHNKMIPHYQVEGAIALREKGRYV